MDRHKVSILLENLRQRIERNSSGDLELKGKLTEHELEALSFAVNFLTGNTKTSAPPPTSGNDRSTNKDTSETTIPLDLSVLDLAPAPGNDLLCLDFGTALSKAAIGHISDDIEDIQVLNIGIPGDQEEENETKLESAIYIDNGGVIWFGHNATKKAQEERLEDESRAIVDNIKRFLSEGAIDDKVSNRMNPTDCVATNRDLILAYLAFFTWCAAECLAAMGVPRNIKRRFAVPCLKNLRRNDVVSRMKTLVGEAQILADTFGDHFIKGINLRDFLDAARRLQKAELHFPFVDQEIVEPLAVTGAIMSWEKQTHNLLLVIDIGAGTTDFGLFLVRYNSNTGASIVESIENGYEIISKAGNFIDRILMERVLSEAGLGPSHPMAQGQRRAFELDVRSYKETLFSDKSVPISLLTGDVVTIDIASFMAMKQIEDFATEFENKVIDLLEKVDESHLKGAPRGELAVKITGGGATLPFAQRLFDRKKITIGQATLELKKVRDLPEWLSESSPHLEDDFPQLAVAIGGARAPQLNYAGDISCTFGASGPVQIGGYYTKGG
jgi:hypothetical protein